MAEPSEFEQLTLELINQFRADPTNEFARLFPTDGAQANIQSAVDFFGVDLDALQAQLSVLSEQAPLAWNSALNDAATTHSQVMIDYDQQSHLVLDPDGNPVEPILGDRIVDAGYNNRQAWGENIFAFTDDALHGHAGFIIDWGFDLIDRDANGTLFPDWQTRGDGIQDPAGHRNSLISSTFTEIGIGAIFETDPNTGVGDIVLTQNFGTRFDYIPQFVGVVINDLDNDEFYDIGEGLGGITVTATNGSTTLTTTTWAAGGYQLEATPGTYTITFSGAALGASITQTVTIGNENIKVDAISNNNFGATLGNDLLDGTSGADHINGLAGDDTLIGGLGADVLNGGEGSDTASYENSSGLAIIDLFGGPNFGVEAAGDTFVSIENVTGSAFGDIIQGNQEANVINGLGGADNLTAFGGADTVNGGEGADFIQGVSGNNTINGDGGADTIFGGVDADTINGGTEGDTLFGADGNDTINGDAGNDGINAGAGNDTVDGGAGSDVIFGDSGIDMISGGDDGDTIFGGADADTLFGNDGDDALVGEGGGDFILGGDGLDFLSGGAGVDILNGHAGSDLISGGDDGDILNGGDDGDVLFGDAGADTLNGGAGVDVLFGDDNALSAVGAGGDVLNGGDDGDLLFGGSGVDTLNGDAGDDVIFGGADADFIRGGSGTDFLTGDGGADVFIFEVGQDFDGVLDFEDGIDTLDLTAFGFADEATALAAAVDDSAGVFFNFGDGDSATIFGVTEADLMGDILV